ncbi:MAG: AAA family ATPase [Verrucomicrobia bacterium]|nr:AAA family ATPase [Verrucomicrobiota bacterium]
MAWDNLCSLPFPRLDRLLLSYAEHDGEAGRAEIERLIATYPSQRPAALRARIALIARDAGRVADLTRLPFIVSQLPEGGKGFLAQTPRVRELVNEISRQQTLLNTLDRPVLREPHARLLHTEIENFRHTVSGMAEPLATGFRAAAFRWLETADRQLAEAVAITARQPTPQVFRAGDPVDQSKEAFVPRNGVFGELERQMTLATGCPALVLYGRRRVGKSTVLRNVAGFLPSSVRVVVVSMEDAKAFTSLDLLLALLADRIQSHLPEGRRLELVTKDLPCFRDFLGQVNGSLQDGNRRLLVALDEYEYVDQKIGEGVFSKDFLALLRESIQTHRQLTWLLAGSHEIGELSHAEWPSYLISARTVEVGLFSADETRLLLTDPLRYCPLWAKDDPKRPRFDPAFWGEGGIERIHREAGGWPHLVQLIAETTVDLLNDSEQRQADAQVLERALNKAIVSGDIVLRQLVQNECRLPDEWEYVSRFRNVESQPPPGDEAIHRSLRRRLLVAEEKGVWRLRVPLMQRWLRTRG